MSAADLTPTPSASPAVDRENPWPGLGSYDESMHAFFFGRDAEVEELLRLVRRDPVALFYGQSGLGKSSLLQAGLFPRLRAADMMPVHIRLRFGAGFPHPVTQILQEVAAAARRAGGESAPPPDGVSLFEYFYDEAHEFWSARNRVLTPVVVFDQFEEIFTLGARDSAAKTHRAELLAQIADLAARRAPDSLVARFEHEPELASRYSVDRTRCRLLFSLREDFLPELGSLNQHLPTLSSGGLRLQRLRGHQACEVLEKPGAHLLEPGSTDRIIRFVAAERAAGGAHELSELEVEPALLNVVARELNNRRRARGLDRISADLVQGARNEILVDFYERAFDGLEPQVREFVEDQLLTTTGFRDSVAVEDAEASYRVSRDTLSVLVDRRLLRIDERFEMQRVELTHDLLTGVVKASRDSRRERETVAAERRRAEEAKRAAEQAAAEAQAKLRHTRTRALITIAMGALAVGVGGLMYLNHRKAEEARRLDTERQAAIEARQAADAAREDARTNLKRANVAMARSLLVQSDVALARGGLDEAQLYLRMGQDHGIFPAESVGWVSAALNQPRILALEALLRLDEPVSQVEFAPGGRIVAATAAGRVHLATIAAATGTVESTKLDTPVGALGEANDATCVEVFWDTPALVAVGRRSRSVQLFDLTSGRLVRELAVPAPASSPADSENQGSATKADTATEAASQQTPAADAVECARFSADGRSLAAVTSDGLVTVWQLAPDASWIPNEGASSQTAKDPLVESHAGGNLRSAKPQPGLTTISWSVDGSLLVSTARATAWFPRPTPGWGKAPLLATFEYEALRGTVRASKHGDGSEWFVADTKESRLHWMHLPSATTSGATSSVARTSEFIPDTVHSIAAMPGADVIFVAMRNGAIAACRTDISTQQPSLRLLQTAATARARLVTLRVRPDGRFLSATSDDGLVCLYRVSIPSVLRNDTSDAGDLVRSGETWLHRHSDGRLLRVDGSTAPGPDPFPSSDGVADVIHFPDPAVPEQALVLLTRYESETATCGVLRPRSGEMLWERPLKSMSEAGILDHSVAKFSPDGSILALPTIDGRILLLSALTGESAGPPLIFSGDIHHIAWSGNGRRLAVSNGLREIAVFEPGSGDRPIVTLHARHSFLSSIALDAAGHTLAYATDDARLVLERIAPGESSASIAMALPAVASKVALASAKERGPVSIAVIIQHSMQVFEAMLPTERDLEWVNFAAVDGYETTPTTPASTDTTRLAAIWTDDSVNFAAAALLRDTFAWIGSATSLFSTGSTEVIATRLEELRVAGDSLRGRFDKLAPAQPAFAAFRDRLAEATADLVEFSTELAPNLTPLQLWPIVAYQHSLVPESGVAVEFAVNKALPAVLAEMKARTDKSPALTDAQRERYQEIVRFATRSTEAEDTIWEGRATLLQTLYTPEQWVSLVIDSPSEFLIDREANALASEGEMETSNRLYSELESRKPDALTYPIRRANNLRKMGQVQEALELFDRVAAQAAASGDGEVEAEARVYRAWTFQKMDGRMSDAREDMVAAARLAPHDAWTLRNAIEFFRSNDTPADGVDAAARLVEVQDTPANRMLQARVHLALGDGAAARAAVEPLANSTDISARLDVVDLFSEDSAYRNCVFAGEWAYSAYQATSDRELEDRALRSLGPLWLATDNLVFARNALDRLFDYKLSLEKQALVRALQGRIDMRRRDLVSGRASYEAALRLEPAPAARIRRDHGHFLEWSGDAAGALTELAAASEAGDAEDALAHVLALRRLGTATQADSALAAALARFPDDRTLRLAHARQLLATDRATAERELMALDDGSLDLVALTAAALLGRGAEAAQRNLPSLADTYGSDHLLQASLHILAFEQTREPAQRLAALRELSTAIDRGYRGDVRLRAMPEFAPFVDDPIFVLADEALALEDGSRGGLFALARFNTRVAAPVVNQEIKSLLLARARAALSRGVELEVFTPADVLADAELAPFGAQF